MCSSNPEASLVLAEMTAPNDDENQRVGYNLFFFRQEPNNPFPPNPYIERFLREFAEREAPYQVLTIPAYAYERRPWRGPIFARWEDANDENWVWGVRVSELIRCVSLLTSSI